MTLFVHEWGDPGAPALVCLHGLLAHGRRFRRLAEERLAARFHVLAPDLRGHGRSPREPPWTLAQHVADVVELLDERGLERAAFVGHSFGGRVTIELTAFGRVERAVWLDPAIWAPPSIALDVAERARAQPVFEAVDEAIAARRPTASFASDEMWAEEMRDHLERADDGRWRYRYCTAAVVTAYGELAQPPPDWALLQVPTLLVVGEHTDVVPDAVVAAVRHELREHVEVVTVRGGHIPLWDAYDSTAEAVDGFL